MLNYNKIFLISFTIFIISISTLFIPGLLKYESVLRAPAELEPQELEGAKSVLQQCNLKGDDYNRINSVIFEAGKELYLKKDPVAAEKLFKTIRSDLINCKLKPQGERPPIDTIFENLIPIISIASGISTLTTGVLDYIKKKKVN